MAAGLNGKAMSWFCGKKKEKRPLHHHTICNLEFPSCLCVVCLSVFIFTASALLKISATAFIVAANFKALHGCVLTQRQPGEGVGLWQDDEVVAGAG